MAQPPGGKGRNIQESLCFLPDDRLGEQGRSTAIEPRRLLACVGKPDALGKGGGTVQNTVWLFDGNPFNIDIFRKRA